MANNFTVKAISEQGDQIERATATIHKIIQEEKVEVLIKEIIRIRPQDFQAFKHALEDFVHVWDQ